MAPPTPNRHESTQRLQLGFTVWQFSQSNQPSYHTPSSEEMPTTCEQRQVCRFSPHSAPAAVNLISPILQNVKHASYPPKHHRNDSVIPTHVIPTPLHTLPDEVLAKICCYINPPTFNIKFGLINKQCLLFKAKHEQHYYRSILASLDLAYTIQHGPAGAAIQLMLNHIHNTLLKHVNMPKWSWKDLFKSIVATQKCVICRALAYRIFLFTNERVCDRCLRDHPRFMVMSKSYAKTNYLLTDKMIRNLHSVELCFDKSSSSSKSVSLPASAKAEKFELVCDVEAKAQALEVWKCTEVLESEKSKRVDAARESYDKRFEEYQNQQKLEGHSNNRMKRKAPQLPPLLKQVDRRPFADQYQYRQAVTLPLALFYDKSTLESSPCLLCRVCFEVEEERRPSCGPFREPVATAHKGWEAFSHHLLMHHPEIELD
ncbi:hypothetical protein SeMB42_g07628 [Synchytrium endobioticum]|uniref:F-box domain-containing protein n=1 Tax=Synchytrium endobioticum TaxID=286115 RepID=A0A507C2K9_9FUNG|nr:hypothetical protein SeMB42_g07628 [Synchytrium endobioticum]